MRKLISFEQISRIHIFRHVRELVAPAVGDDHVAAGLEGLQVVGHLGAEELRRVQRGLVDHHDRHMAFMRFMTPWMELARKLSEVGFIIRRRMPTIGFSLLQHSHKLIRTLNKYDGEPYLRKGSPDSNQ